MSACIPVLGLLAAALAMPTSAAATVTGTPATLPSWPMTGFAVDIELEPSTALFHVVQRGPDRVVVVDATGAEVRSYGEANLTDPRSIAFGPTIAYVTTDSDTVEFFNLTTGAYLGGWGGFGTTAGKFDDPWGIAVNNNEVYVSDRGNSRVQVFAPFGAWIRTIDGAGTPFGLQFPTGLSIYDGVLYVLDEGRGEAVLFDSVSGVPSASFAGMPNQVRGIEITNQGDVFISEVFTNHIRVYTAAGDFQTSFPALGGGGLAVDPTGNSLWVTHRTLNEIKPFSWLTCAGLTPTIVGTSYDDTFVTGSADDVVALDSGSDDVSLGAGDDVACGDGGLDTINGEGGDDSIYGGGSADTLIGGPGSDLLDGQAGADVIRGGGGNDFLYGGEGPDTIKGQGGPDVIDGGGGADKIDGQGAADVIDGGGGGDTINGQNGADVVMGGPGADSVKTQTGPDELHGDGDDDVLTGGDGADVLYGGPGFDRCSGNTGPDSAEAATCEQTPGVETLF